MAATLAHTIAVVDKSGKVVSTSKQLRNVFMEAKFAYQERKAEIVADRRAKSGSKTHKEKDLRRAVTGLHIEDAPSEASERSHRSSRHHSHRHDSHRRPRREELERHNSESTVRRRRRHSPSSPRSPASHHSHSPRLSHDEAQQSHSAPSSPTIRDNESLRHSLSLVRRRTDLDLVTTSPRKAPTRSMSATAIDMDLAYGDYHPSSIAPIRSAPDENELLTLVDRAKLLLDEANCAQHSVKAIIEHLQKNPDAMAAVALTLAEISNVAAKMAPGALTALKGSAPAVFALLASPQFLVAAGVGIGVTIVMFGGYKIIKKIKAKAADKDGQSVDEMMAVDSDEFSRINTWRRGIEAPDAIDGVSESGTSVEGEFITPIAATMRGMETRETLVKDSERKKQDKKDKKAREKEVKKGKKESKKGKDKEKSDLGESETASVDSRRSSRTASTLSPVEAARKALVKVKKPSPLRRLLA